MAYCYWNLLLKVEIIASFKIQDIYNNDTN